MNILLSLVLSFMKLSFFITLVTAFFVTCADSSQFFEDVSKEMREKIVSSSYEVTDSFILVRCVDNLGHTHEAHLSHIRASATENNMYFSYLPSEEYLADVKSFRTSFVRVVSKEEEDGIEKYTLLYSGFLGYEADENVALPFNFTMSRGVVETAYEDYFIPCPEVELLGVRYIKIEECKNTQDSVYNHYSVSFELTLGYEGLEFDIPSRFKVKSSHPCYIEFGASVGEWDNDTLTDIKV